MVQAMEQEPGIQWAELVQTGAAQEEAQAVEEVQRVAGILQDIDRVLTYSC